MLNNKLANLLWILIILSAFILTCGANPTSADLSPGNWDSCKQGASTPSTRVNTFDRIQVLRSYFATEDIHAYLIPSEDAHQSEYPSQYDKRRGYISGFQGSAGYAVVTISKQALWTDGRYFIEAENTLDCNWILMRDGVSGVPTMAEWLKSELSNGQKLGASPYLVDNFYWKTNSEELFKHGIQMTTVDPELIDKFWSTNNGRPPQSSTYLYPLPLSMSGISWQDKIIDMRRTMKEEDVDMMVVTALDEIAWLFNLRANDIDYNPLFISYAVVEMNVVTLYLMDHIRKLNATSSDPEINPIAVADHLNTNTDGTCRNKMKTCVEIKEYNPTVVLDEIHGKSINATKVWLGFSCNQAIYRAVLQGKVHLDNTPVATAKAKKNPVEVDGMKRAQIRDAVALITFLSMLEKEVKAGKRWTELTAAMKLDAYRRKQKYNKGLSFRTISAFGSNGDIIHYSVSNATDKAITTTSLYLIDSGGQYLDGTTDVTRTLHYGTPAEYEKECYTRVLMGHIDLFQTKWPKSLYGREIDAFARRPLWDAGLVYRHGTGHGIGMFLSVHEGPGRISLSHTEFKRDNALDENQFFSNEPGYYEAGMFGIRLENIIMIKNATTKYSFSGTQFLTFEHITLVPYEPNLINVDMLNDDQISYLNDYNKLCRDKVGPELLAQGQEEAYDWLRIKTELITLHSKVINSASKVCSACLVIILNSVALLKLLLLL